MKNEEIKKQIFELVKNKPMWFAGVIQEISFKFKYKIRHLEIVKIIMEMLEKREIFFTKDRKLTLHENSSYSLDQPKPEKGFDDMWNRLIERSSSDENFYFNSILPLMIERRNLGIQKYGTVLQAHNGRNAFEDMLMELLDFIAYSEIINIEKPKYSKEILEMQDTVIKMIETINEWNEYENK